MTKNNPPVEFVTVCFQNFDHITKKLILSCLKDPGYAIELMEEPEDSDLCLYNQESPSDQQEITAIHERLDVLGVPMILLTTEEQSSDNQRLEVIKKPVKNSKLSEFLSQVNSAVYTRIRNKLKQQADAKPTKLIYNKHLSNAINPNQIRYEGNRYYAQKYVGLNPDIDFSDEEQIKQVQFNLQNYFFYYLKAAFVLSKSKSKIACVKTVYGTFYVDAMRKVIHHEKTADEIFNIHKIPFYKDTKVSIAKLKRDELLALNQFDYEPFVWLSSINASKGKVPNDVSFNAPIKLVAWPDLTKVIVFKHAIRIIALWSRGVYSLQNTGKLLNIPQRYPLTVYTALYALGLIADVKRR